MRHPRLAPARRGPDLLNDATRTTGTGPVTVVATRVVTKGCEDAFQDWANRSDAAVRAHDGHRGNVRLEQAGGVFHLVYQFESRNQLDAWEQSDCFRTLAAEADDFSISRRQTKPGRDAFFYLSGDADAAKWKRFVMTWAAVLPLILALNGLLALLPFELPMPVRLGLSSLVMSALLTWLILPWITRRLKPWVMADGKGEVRDEA